MNIAQASIRNSTITWVFIVMMFVGGLYAYDKLGRLEDPEFTIKSAQVFTAYPGATAEEVAAEVTDELETAIQQMGQLKLLTSISEPGKSTILVEVKDKYDKNSLPQVWDELRRKVADAQRLLPPGAGPSVVYDDYGDVFGVFYAVYGDGFSYAELKDHVDTLRRELLLCDDVGKIMTYGELPEVVYIEMSRVRLAQLGLSPQTVMATLKGQNLVAVAGRVEVGSQYIRIQPTGEIKSVEQLGDLLILQQDAGATKLYLKDIATIQRGYQDPPGKIMRFNGRPAIGLGISTVLGGNVITMGESLDARLAQLQARTPIGIEIGVIAHQANAVNTAVNSFVVSLAQAVAIVVAVLMIAMGLRSGLLIGVILVLTVLASFVVMWMQGIMLERISLGALIIALGMLVDNAIVVVEGILMNIQRGMERVAAAAAIVKQTIWPLFGATVVAVLAFASIGVSQDSTGEYCRSLFSVILISLMMSWVLAITVTPLLGVKFLKIKQLQGDADPYGGLLFRGYRSFLTGCIRMRWFTILVLLGMLGSASYGFTMVSKSFFPPSTRPQFMVHYWLPQGTHVRRTEDEMIKIEQHLLENYKGNKANAQNAKDDYGDAIQDIATFVGGGAQRFLLTYTPEDANSSYGMFLVTVNDFAQIDGLMAQIQEYFDDSYPDAQAFSRKFMLGPGEPQKIHLRFRGDDFQALRALAAETTQIMRSEPLATDVLDDWRQPVPMIRPLVAEAPARNAGLTRAQIANSLQFAFEGAPVGVYREGDLLLPIIFRAPDNERLGATNIKDVQVYSPVAGRGIPIQQVVHGFDIVPENTLVHRRNRLATITVKCDPAVGAAEPVRQILAKKIEENQQIQTLLNDSGVVMTWGGEFEDSGDAQAGLAGKMPIVALMMILTVIVLFNSIRQPVIIFLTVPLALIGVTAGLLLTSQPFGFMALLGFMSLSGMLIKNAIVLIDEINVQHAEGKAPYEAVIISGVSRLRPVGMAALTTVLGMIPLLADAFFVAMAVTIMFGLAFATVLTLVVVPLLYTIFYRVPSPARA